MAFDEVRLPEGIDYGFTGGPEFNTTIDESWNGYEQRFINWSIERGRWNITKSVQDQSEIEAIQAFFRARKGRARGFRFKDWADYQATNQNIGTGNGVTLAFQARKRYTSSVTYDRTIYKLVNTTLLVYVDGVLKTEGANPGGDYTVNYNTGVITFNAGKAPGNGLAVTATFEFDVPVRFDTDHLQVTVDSYQNYSISSLPIRETRDIS